MFTRRLLAVLSIQIILGPLVLHAESIPVSEQAAPSVPLRFAGSGSSVVLGTDAFLPLLILPRELLSSGLP